MDGGGRGREKEGRLRGGGVVERGGGGGGGQDRSKERGEDEAAGSENSLLISQAGLTSGGAVSKKATGLDFEEQILHGIGTTLARHWHGRNLHSTPNVKRARTPAGSWLALFALGSLVTIWGGAF